MVKQESNRLRGDLNTIEKQRSTMAYAKECADQIETYTCKLGTETNEQLRELYARMLEAAKKHLETAMV